HAPADGARAARTGFSSRHLRNPLQRPPFSNSSAKRFSSGSSPSASTAETSKPSSAARAASRRRPASIQSAARLRNAAQSAPSAKADGSVGASTSNCPSPTALARNSRDDAAASPKPSAAPASPKAAANDD